MTPPEERSFWLARHVMPHEAALRAWLSHRRIDGLETDDIVQETYAVLASLPAVAHIAAPRAYAFHTANSVILRSLRRSRVVRIDTIGDVESLFTALDAPSPERQIAARQALRQVSALISALPPKCREAFMMRRVEGLSQRATALRMHISESTVEKHVGRALRLLMPAISALGLQGPETQKDRTPSGVRPISP